MSSEDFKFDPVRHIYTLYGRRIPSVTQILKPLTESIYSAIPKEVLDKACARGNYIHKYIENIIKGESDKVDNLYLDEYKNYLIAAEAWLNNSNLIKFSEVKSEVMGWAEIEGMYFAGTADIIGNGLVADIKTREVKPAIDILQLTIYDVMFNKKLNSKKLIISILKDGSYVENDLNRYDAHNEAFRIFTELLRLYYTKVKIVDWHALYSKEKLLGK